MCVANLYVDSNLPLNTVKLILFEVLGLYEYTDLLTYVDSYDLSTGNNYPTEVITIVLFGIPSKNKFGLVDVVK